MFNEEELVNKALNIGFDKAKKLERSSLVFNELVRDMCSKDKCHNYGKSWSCPPGCGSIEESFKKTNDYPYGIIVETIKSLEDDFDYEGMMETAEKHQKLVQLFASKLRKENYNFLPMGSGGCKLCEKCTYPDNPCRHPNEMVISMEAYGLFVSDVCKKSGIPYNHGPNTITFIGCFLFK